MDNLFTALILSIVEGLTEFLPVSSSGHLILVGDLLSFYVERLRMGQKSITSKVEVFAERLDGSCVRITEAVMTFVAIDDAGRSRLIA